ncbi:MAG: SUF system NifU family Fe-S cluster assembly protein [Woeseiaceae bacterium]|nr:SUF system NifU family Fe-S cluster assembly protein [Woeseiaceae bacterium]
MSSGHVQSLSSDELRELYRSLILDHAKNPRHFGKLDTATHTSEGINPLCGDKLRLQLEVDAEHRIRDAAFEGTGCAISVASASLLTETIIGLHEDEALAWFDDVTSHLTGTSDANGRDLGKLQALGGVRDFPARVKCATLAWHALRSAIENTDEPVSTE